MVYRVPRSAGRELAFEAFKGARDRIWTTSRPGVRWPRNMGATGGNGPGLRHPVRKSPSSPNDINTGWTSTAGCGGSSTTSWPKRSPKALRAGMSLGVMHDLAVGVHPSGADAWSLQEVLALGVTAGLRPMSSTSWDRTGHSRRGALIGSKSSATNRLGRSSPRS